MAQVATVELNKTVFDDEAVANGDKGTSIAGRKLWDRIFNSNIFNTKNFYH